MATKARWELQIRPTIEEVSNEKTISINKLFLEDNQ